MKVLLLGVQLTSLVNFRGPLIRDLVAAGHEVVAVAPEPVEPALSQLQAIGALYREAPLARTGLNPVADLSVFLWLVRLFRQEKPDALLAFQAKAVIYGIPAAWFARILHRVAMIEGVGQGFIQTKGGLKRRIVRFLVPLLYRISLSFAQAIIFLNKDDEADFRAHGIVHRQRVLQIPGIGVDLSHYAAQPLPPLPLTFLMIGRLIVDKGVREYLAAAQRVKALYPDVRFQLLGARDRSHVGIPVGEVEAGGAVEYLGEVQDVRPILAGCHVFVLPSYREGMPRSTMEAMATARAVITTDVPGARETVMDQKNGRLVRARDTESLAAAMIALIQSPEQVQCMGQQSRVLAEQRYDVHRINQLILSVLIPQMSGNQ